MSENNRFEQTGSSAEVSWNDSFHSIDDIKAADHAVQQDPTPRLAGDIDTSGGPIDKQQSTDNAFSSRGLENARLTREAVKGRIRR
ncbi:hypothetical protein [Peribacillus sp. SCS-155]|uniref:hypothetical protein n=1 Tax=Peribacillus sedimenti TaxID=3115297 RepID=UPI003905FC99